MDQEIHYIGDLKSKTSTHFKQSSRKYQAKNCSKCPVNGICYKSEKKKEL